MNFDELEAELNKLTIENRNTINNYQSQSPRNTTNVSTGSNNNSNERIAKLENNIKRLKDAILEEREIHRQNIDDIEKERQLDFDRMDQLEKKLIQLANLYKTEKEKGNQSNKSGNDNLVNDLKNQVKELENNIQDQSQQFTDQIQGLSEQLRIANDRASSNENLANQEKKKL